jgi:4'-phosphopantetheinyl transferase
MVGRARLVTDIYWSFSRNQASLTGEEKDFLSPAEKSRLAGLRFEKRRTDWLQGRWAVKNMLTRCGGLPPNAGLNTVQVWNEASGKPVLVDQSGQCLPGGVSISHRTDAVLCAYAPDPKVQFGVDLELLEPKEPGFFTDYFTPAEQEAAVRCGGRRDTAILLAWCGKEAVFKSMGTGLRMDTRVVEIGGYDWIASSPVNADQWYDLTVSTRVTDHRLIGKWMLHGEFILVIVFREGEDPIRLVEA